MAADPPLIALRAASLGFGGTPLFQDLSAAIGRGERICLVGRNGSGKSSLMRVLAGQVELDHGERFLHPGTTVAYLPQNPQVAGGQTAGDYACGGGAPRHRAEAALERLGIEPDRPTDGLSGGEARRLALARAFAVDPDILLLDEPTNHLDLPAIEWLENVLPGLRAGMLIVSHDRRFLETVTRRTWWLRGGSLLSNDVGYGGFEAWAESLAEAEAAELARLTQHLKAETRYLHRGVTARRRRNQRRLRRLADLRVERAQMIRQEGSVGLKAAATPESGRLMIEATDLVKSYDGRPVVAGFSTRIRRGDRIGIIGPNGAGKTTLLNMLIGALAPDSGRVRLGERVAIARFDQRREQLDPDATLWETLCPAGGDSLMVNGSPRHVVAYLRDFLFDEAQARSPVRTLSGGESNRLLLAKILAAPANLLALDEPTNDLDMDTLDVLEDVLEGFEGTLLLVSHDRDFLERLVNSVIAVDRDGTVTEHAGGYDDYRRQATAQDEASRPRADKKQAKTPREAERSTSRNRLSYRDSRDLELLPRRLTELAEEAARLEAALADPKLFQRNPEEFQRQAGRLEAVRSETSTLEERWLELEIKREAIEGAAGR